MLHAADDEVLAQKLLCCLAQLVSVRKSRNGDPLNIIGSIEKTGYVSSGLPLRRDQPSDTYMNDDNDDDDRLPPLPPKPTPWCQNTPANITL